MPLDISYSVLDPDTQKWDHQGTYAEAVLAADYGDQIYVTVFGEPKMELPTAFNRVAMVEDREIRSAVIKQREIELGVRADGSTPDPGPLGPTAPVLVINHEEDRVLWTDHWGTRLIYGKPYPNANEE